LQETILEGVRSHCARSGKYDKWWSSSKPTDYLFPNMKEHLRTHIYCWWERYIHDNWPAGRQEQQLSH